MLEEAVNAGFYSPKIRTAVRKILTFDEVLHGKKIDMPGEMW
jgi:hypothetical protein